MALFFAKEKFARNAAKNQLNASLKNLYSDLLFVI